MFPSAGDFFFNFYRSRLPWQSDRADVTYNIEEKKFKREKKPVPEGFFSTIQSLCGGFLFTSYLSFFYTSPSSCEFLFSFFKSKFFFLHISLSATRYIASFLGFFSFLFFFLSICDDKGDFKMFVVLLVYFFTLKLYEVCSTLPIIRHLKSTFTNILENLGNQKRS